MGTIYFTNQKIHKVGGSEPIQFEKGFSVVAAVPINEKEHFIKDHPDVWEISELEYNELMSITAIYTRI